MELFITNLPYDLTERELAAVFAPCGQVLSVKIANDRETGQSRGFGFVAFADDEAAREAIQRMNGFELGGRQLSVKEARARQGSGQPEPRRESSLHSRGPRMSAPEMAPRPSVSRGPQSFEKTGTEGRFDHGDKAREPAAERDGERSEEGESLDDKDRRRRRLAERSQRGKQHGDKHVAPKEGEVARPPKQEHRARDWDWRHWDDEDETEDREI